MRGNGSVIYRGLHPGQEVAGQDHFTQCGTDLDACQDSIPASVENREDIGRTARLDVYGSVAKSTAPAHELRDHAVVTPYTLSCTT